jgi:hypothetical protein
LGEERVNHILEISRECYGLNFGSANITDVDDDNQESGGNSFYINVTREAQWSPVVEALPLRQSVFYYRFYYVAANTIFATVLPLILLLFLNVRTARELFKMGKNNGGTPVIVGNRTFLVRSSVASRQNLVGMTRPSQAQRLLTSCPSRQRRRRASDGDGAVLARETPSPCPTLVVMNADDILSEASAPLVLSPDVEALKLIPRQTRPRSAAKELRRAVSMILPMSTTTSSNETGKEEEVEEGDEDTIKLVSETNPPDTYGAAGVNNNDDARVSGAHESRLGRLRRGFTLEVGSNMTQRFTKSGDSRIGKVRGNSLSLLRRGADAIRRRRSRLSSATGPSSPVKKSERRLAYISLYIVWLFLFCHVWKLIPTVYEVTTSRNGVQLDEEVDEWPWWMSFISGLSHSLITLNSSLNFLIYVIL